MKGLIFDITKKDAWNELDILKIKLVESKLNRLFNSRNEIFLWEILQAFGINLEVDQNVEWLAHGSSSKIDIFILTNPKGHLYIEPRVVGKLAYSGAIFEGPMDFSKVLGPSSFLVQ